MLVVFSMAAFLWVFGMITQTPKQARWIMIGLLFVAVLAVHIILPNGHPLREGTGGDARLWILLAAFRGACSGLPPWFVVDQSAHKSCQF
jgi:hypothetical protein